MSFRPNIGGPFCPTGALTVTSPGTPISLASNWSPDFNPDTPTNLIPGGGGTVPEYSIRFEDLIINSSPNNAGGLYLIDSTAGSGGTGSPQTILMYIPKGSPPMSVKKYLGGSRFNPSRLGIDSDNSGDTAWCTGIIGA